MKKVVVIGAGYGGLRAIEKLVKSNQVQITLIDKNRFHYLQTEAYGYIAGKFDICDITVDIQSWCDSFENKITFINEDVNFVNSKEQYVQTNKQNISYDDLIVATGAKTNFPSFIKGLREFSHGIKVLERAYHFKSEFEKIIFHKVTSHEKESFNIIIGGAGLSGVEIAAEMAYIAKKFTSSIGIRKSNINIYLVEAYDTILGGMSKYVIQHTMKRLESLGVHVMLHSFIDEVMKDKIILKNKNEIAYDFMIFTGGIKANKIDFDRVVETNKIGQFLVNKSLQIGGLQNCYAIGDCTELRDSADNFLPPTAQSAEQSGSYVAKHILSKYESKSIGDYEGRIDGIFVALGGNYAVGEIYNWIKVKGYCAFVLKKIITKLYHYGLKLRLNNSFILRG